MVHSRWIQDQTPLYAPPSPACRGSMTSSPTYCTINVNVLGPVLESVYTGIILVSLEMTCFAIQGSIVSNTSCEIYAKDFIL